MELSSIVTRWEYPAFIATCSALLLGLSAATASFDAASRRFWTAPVRLAFLQFLALAALIAGLAWPGVASLRALQLGSAATFSLAVCEAALGIAEARASRTSRGSRVILLLPGIAMLYALFRLPTAQAGAWIAGLGAASGLLAAAISPPAARRQEDAATEDCAEHRSRRPVREVSFGLWCAAASVPAPLLAAGHDGPGVWTGGIAVASLAASSILSVRLALRYLRRSSPGAAPPGSSRSVELGLTRSDRLLLAGLLALALVGCWGASALGRLQDEWMRELLLRRATRIASALPSARLPAFSLPRTNTDELRFSRLLDGFGGFVRATPDLQFLYTLYQDADSIRFALDGTPPTDPDYSPPGDSYADAPPETATAFQRAQGLVAGPYTDRWGQFVSAFVPVLDLRRQEVLGVIGMDVAAANWRTDVDRRRLSVFALALALLSLLVLGLMAPRLRSRLGPTAPRPLQYAESIVCGLALVLLFSGSVLVFHRHLTARHSSADFLDMADCDSKFVQDEIRQLELDLETVSGFASRESKVSDPSALAMQLRDMARDRPHLLRLGLVTVRESPGGAPTWEVVADGTADAGQPSWSEELDGIRGAHDRFLTDPPAGLSTAEGPFPDAGGGLGRYLIFRPVENELAAPASAGATRSRTFVVASLDWSRLLRRTWQPQGHAADPGQSVVYELSKSGTGRRVACLGTGSAPSGDQSAKGGEDPGNPHIARFPVFAFGRTWLTECTSPPGRAEGTSSTLAYLIAGLLVAASVTGLLARTQGQQERAEVLVATRTRELVESMQIFRSIGEAAFDAILVMNPEGRISFWNTAATRIFGHEANEVLGKDLHGLLAPPQLRTAFSERHPQFILDGSGPAVGRTVELVALHRGGHEVPVELSLAPIDLDGKWHAVGIVRDISERRRAEQEKEALSRQLFQAQKLESVGQLAAGVAHEINTPIQFINDNLQFVQTSWRELLSVLAPLEELKESARAHPDLAPQVVRADEAAAAVDAAWLQTEVAASLQQSLDGVERVATIVRALKGFAHPNAPARSPTDLNEAIRNTVTVARNEWKYVAECKLDLQPDLPSVPCVGGEISQVLLNLLVNAAHAIAARPDRESGTLGKITITSRTVDESVEIAVSDTGTGISPEIRDRIFDPFFTTKEVGRGTGQGLCIAREIVVLRHKGEITFDSEVGQGTTFRILLPLEEPDRLDAAA